MQKKIEQVEIEQIVAALRGENASLKTAPRALIAAFIDEESPDAERLLNLLEHPEVARRLQDNELPEDVQGLLAGVFPEVTRQLGISAAGNLLNLAARSRARLDAERRKSALVREHLERRRDDVEASVKLVRNYLGTAPAPIFIAEIEALDPALMTRARTELEEGLDLKVLIEDPVLLETLLDPPELDATSAPDLDPEHPANALTARLTDCQARVDAQVGGGPAMVDAYLRRAIKTGSPDAQFIAGALAAFGARLDLVADLLAIFLAGGARAPQLVVMAARIDPMVVRNALAQFLVDIAYQNPEEPEARLTAERTHTILSARSLLPLIGSPLPQMDAGHLPDTDEFAELRPIPGLVQRSWALWQAIRPRP